MRRAHIRADPAAHGATRLRNENMINPNRRPAGDKCVAPAKPRIFVGISVAGPYLPEEHALGRSIEISYDKVRRAARQVFGLPSTQFAVVPQFVNAGRRRRLTESLPRATQMKAQQ